MHTIKALYDGVGFIPKQQVPVRGHYEVIITFVEPITNDKIHADAIKARMDWLNRIETAIELSDDEDLSDFPMQGRMNTSHDDWL